MCMCRWGWPPGELSQGPGVFVGMAWAWSALFHLEDMNVYVHLAWGYLFSFFPGRLVSFGFGCSSAGRMRGSEFVPYGV